MSKPYLRLESGVLSMPAYASGFQDKPSFPKLDEAERSSNLAKEIMNAGLTPSVITHRKKHCEDAAC